MLQHTARIMPVFLCTRGMLLHIEGCVVVVRF